MAPNRVLLDTCVLVPISIADLLRWLSYLGLIEPLWSSEILHELERALRAVHPHLDGDQIGLRVERMCTAFPAATIEIDDSVVRDFDVNLPDPNDLHVFAAAVQAQANAIITFNLRDFPLGLARGFGLEVIHPDVYLVQLLEAEPAAVAEALSKQSQMTASPHLKPELILQRLETMLPRFVAAARARVEHGSGS